jgi:hypothetical protein
MTKLLKIGMTLEDKNQEQNQERLAR